MTRRRALVAVCIIGALLAIRFYDDQPLKGDEPHTVLVAQSLVKDGDFDVKNDYLQGRYHAYYPFLLDPHVNLRRFSADSPHWYSWHGVGPSVLLAPFVWVAGSAGAQLGAVLLAACVLALSFLWVRRFVRRRAAAIASVVLLGTSIAFLGNEGRLFPDLFTGGLLVAALCLLEPADSRTWKLAALGTCIGFSPWIHIKTVPAFAAVGIIAGYRALTARDARSRVRACTALAVPAGILIVGFELATHAWFGSWDPRAAFPPGPPSVFGLAPSSGLAAASFDVARGLFTNSPALLTLFIGLPLWARRAPALFVRVALIVVPGLIIHSTFNDWYGGYAPVSRYALQFIPALLPAVAIVFDRAVDARWRPIPWILLGIQFVFSFVFIARKIPWTIPGQPNYLFTSKGLGAAPSRVMAAFGPSGILRAGRPWLYSWLALAAGLVGIGVFTKESAEREAVSPV